MIGLVLAAGAGRRLRPYTDTLPKALVPIDPETTVLDVILANYAEVGITDVAVVVGYAADAHDIALPEPEGRGATSAMKRALVHAGADANEIRHVNAHATSTPAGDAVETKAIRNALGDAAADQITVTATKSMTGHLLGGAGAVESIITVLSLHHRQVPATINVEDLDDEVVTDVVRNEPRALPDGPIAAINNSFGFGGADVALVFRSA